MQTLQSLKDSLRRREEEKRRHAEYKEKKRALGPPPTKLEDFGEFGSTGRSGFSGGGGMATGRTTERLGTGDGGSSQGAGPATAAPNLLQSLNRLVELEKRITKLEDMDGYDAAATPRSQHSGTQSQSNLRGKAMAFTRKRTVARPGAPAKTVFAVKLVDKASVAASKRKTLPNVATQQRQNALSRNWLADRKAAQAQRKQRMESDYGTARPNAAQRGGGRTGGGSSWLAGRSGAAGNNNTRSTGFATRGARTAPVGLGTGAPAAGSRGAVAARQVQASRAAVTGAGTATMGSRKLVGRGAAQMNSFHEMRREFESRKAAAGAQKPAGRAGAAARSGAGRFSGNSTAPAAARGPASTGASRFTGASGARRPVSAAGLL